MERAPGAVGCGANLSYQENWKATATTAQFSTINTGATFTPDVRLAVNGHAITNCQIGVFASYVSRHGHAFFDRALYLPKEWTDDPERMTAAHVPDNVSFATKPQLARNTSGVRL